MTWLLKVNADISLGCLQAQHAINELYTRVLAERALASNVLISFDHETTRYELDPVDSSSCAAVVNSICASGGTSFAVALEGMHTLTHAHSTFV